MLLYNHKKFGDLKTFEQSGGYDYGKQFKRNGNRKGNFTDNRNHALHWMDHQPWHTQVPEERMPQRRKRRQQLLLPA